MDTKELEAFCKYGLELEQKASPELWKFSEGAIYLKRADGKPYVMYAVDPDKGPGKFIPKQDGELIVFLRSGLKDVLNSCLRLLKQDRGRDDSRNKKD